MDYHSGQYEVIFVSNQTSASINISIFEDAIRESDEKFELIINKKLPNRVSRDKDQHQATVIIKDTTGERCFIYKCWTIVSLLAIFLSVIYGFAVQHRIYKRN